MSIRTNTTISAITARDAVKAIIINTCEAIDFMYSEQDTAMYDYWAAEVDKFNTVLLRVFRIQVIFDTPNKYRLYKFDNGKVTKSRVFYVDYSNDYGDKTLYFIG